MVNAPCQPIRRAIGFDLGHVRLLSWLHLYSFQQREMDQRMADAPANPK
jgi:hypothetical protein